MPRVALHPRGRRARGRNVGLLVGALGAADASRAWAARVVGVTVAAGVLVALRLTGAPLALGVLGAPLVYAASTVPLRLALRRSDVRAAYEAFLWHGRWELERWRSLARGEPPRSPRAAAAWLATHADVPPMTRIEPAVWAERYDEARTALARMPAGTPYERYERAAHADFVAFVEHGAPLDPAVPASADAVDDPELRLHAAVGVATARARRLAAEGLDPCPPLAQVRAELGPRARLGPGDPYVRTLLVTELVSGIGIALVALLMWGPIP